MGAVVPRFPSVWCSVILGTSTVVLCLAGLCGCGTLDVEADDALHRGAYELVEFACAKGTVGTRPADVVVIPISLHSEQESKLVFSFL